MRQYLLSFGAESFVFQFATQKYKHQFIRIVILSVVWDGLQTLSLTLREKHRMRRILGPERDEVTGEWTKLHNHVLYDLYSSVF
jgi:hypothetical protein